MNLFVTHRRAGPGWHLLRDLPILDSQPTPRDWFVAATIIQWLGTNVGMCILTEAGFAYMAWDRDRAQETGKASP